jgi:hypothetical protein
VTRSAVLSLSSPVTVLRRSTGMPPARLADNWRMRPAAGRSPLLFRVREWAQARGVAAARLSRLGAPRRSAMSGYGTHSRCTNPGEVSIGRRRASWGRKARQRIPACPRPRAVIGTIPGRAGLCLMVAAWSGFAAASVNRARQGEAGCPGGVMCVVQGEGVNPTKPIDIVSCGLVPYGDRGDTRS